MADKESRSGILSAVSDWIKLLALIVLVGEAVILAAIGLTPATHPLATWYPVFMLLFLLVVVAGVVFDRYLSHRSGLRDLTVPVGDKALTVSGKQFQEVAPSTATDPERVYVDSRLGFRFELPTSLKWSKPEQMTACEHLVRQGVLPDAAAIPNFKKALALQPMGEMLAEGTVLLLTHGEPVTAEVTDETTMDALDTQLARLKELAVGQGEQVTDEQLADLRREVVAKKTLRKRFPVQNTFAVSVMDKSLADELVPATAANLFAQSLVGGGTLDKLVADERSVLSGSKQTWRHILVNGRDGELTLYGVNLITQSDRYLYKVEILFSPQTQTPLDVLDELQRMLQSFRMLSRST